MSCCGDEFKDSEEEEGRMWRRFFAVQYAIELEGFNEEPDAKRLAKLRVMEAECLRALGLRLSYSQIF